MLTNLKYNIVLSFGKILFYLKFSYTILIFYRTVTVAFGKLYTELFVLAQSHEIIY